MIKFRFQYLAMLILMVVGLGLSPITNALNAQDNQQDLPDSYRLRGTISEINGSRVTLANGNISLELNRAMSSSDNFPPGSVVEVRKYLKPVNEGNNRKSQSDTIFKHSDIFPGRMMGNLQAVNFQDRTITVFDQQIKLTDATDIRTLQEHKFPRDMSVLKPGHSISVHVNVIDDQLVAKWISISEDDKDYVNTISGPVVNINGRVLQILTSKFVVELPEQNADFQVRSLWRAGLYCPELPLKMIKPGLKAILTFKKTDSGTQRLSHLSVELPGSGYIEGPLEAIDEQAGSITLAGNKFYFDEETDFSEDLKSNDWQGLKNAPRLHINFQAHGDKVFITYITPIKKNAALMTVGSSCKNLKK